MIEPIRAFIAIELPVSVKSALAILQDKLKSSGEDSVKWVDPCNIHLTLKFLGNVNSGKIPLIEQSIKEAVTGIHRLQLNFERLGAFPSLRAPRVVWVGLCGETAVMLSVQGGIEGALAKLGFVSEKRPFSPHLTLGRIRERATSEEQHRLGEKVASLKMDTIEAFTVDAVSLMRSTLTREGAVYNRLCSVLLKDK